MAYVRGLIEESTFQFLNKELEEMPQLLNQLIKFTNDKLKY